MKKKLLAFTGIVAMLMISGAAQAGYYHHGHGYHHHGHHYGYCTHPEPPFIW